MSLIDDATQVPFQTVCAVVERVWQPGFQGDTAQIPLTEEARFQAGDVAAIRTLFADHGMTLSTALELGRSDDTYTLFDRSGHGTLYCAQPIRPRNVLWIGRAIVTPSIASGAIVGPRHVLTVNHNFAGPPNATFPCNRWAAPAFNGAEEALVDLDAYRGSHPDHLQPVAIGSHPLPEQPILLNDDVVTRISGAVHANGDLRLIHTIEPFSSATVAAVNPAHHGGTPYMVVANPAHLGLTVGTEVHTAGYPTGHNGRMWHAQGELLAIEEGFFIFSGEGIENGCSGGPIWVWDKGVAVIIGALSGSGPDMSFRPGDAGERRIFELARDHHVGASFTVAGYERFRNDAGIWSVEQV